jgi:hypothetical protein
LPIRTAHSFSVTWAIRFGLRSRGVALPRGRADVLGHFLIEDLFPHGLDGVADAVSDGQAGRLGDVVAC